MIDAFAHAMFNNFYYKLFFAAVLCLVLSFANKIEVLKDGGIAYVILVLFALMSFTMKDDYGMVVLVGGLFVLTYNNVMFRKNDNRPAFKLPRV